MSQAFNAAAVFVLLITAGALVGTAQPIGVHPECLDDIDNDGDAVFGNPEGGVDINGAPNGPAVSPLMLYPDRSCVEYPFADGNGESFTPPEERFTSSKGYIGTAFEVFLMHEAEHDESDIAQGEIPRSERMPCEYPPIDWFPVEDGSRDQAMLYCSPP